MVLFVLFLRKRLLRLLCGLLLFVHVEKRSNFDIRGKTLRSSRSRMFFKIAVHKNLAILPRKHMRCSLFFDKVVGLLFLLKNTFCSLYFSEILSDDRILWTSLGTKLIFFIFFVPLLWFFFIILVLHSGVHGYFALVFIPTFLVSITFAHFRMPHSETTSRIIATSPSNLLWRMWIWLFWILCFAITFL